MKCTCPRFRPKKKRSAIHSGFSVRTRNRPKPNRKFRQKVQTVKSKFQPKIRRQRGMSLVYKFFLPLAARFLGPLVVIYSNISRVRTSDRRSHCLYPKYAEYVCSTIRNPSVPLDRIEGVTLVTPRCPRFFAPRGFGGRPTPAMS